MKKLIVLLISIFSVAYGMVQKWVLDSSVWKIGEAWAGTPPHYFEVTVIGDTTVLGETCKKLSNGIITFERNDTVFVLYDGNFHSVLYFSVQIGDTIPIFDYHGKTWGFGQSSDTVWAKVSAIDSVYTGNKYLKRFYLDILYPTSVITIPGLLYSYIENAGSNYILPYFYYDNGFIFDQPSFGVCDYGDSTIQNFWLYNNFCETVGIVEKSDLKISVFPNPASSRINIVSQYYDIQEASIYSIHRQRKNIVVNGNFKEVQVDISTLPSGIYFLHLQLSNGRNYVKRIIKQ